MKNYYFFIAFIIFIVVIYLLKNSCSEITNKMTSKIGGLDYKILSQNAFEKEDLKKEDLKKEDLKKEMRIISVDSTCYESYPCQHRCKYVLDGKIHEELLSGRKIIKHKYALTSEQTNHFSLYEEPVFPEIIAIGQPEYGLAMPYTMVRCDMCGHIYSVTRGWLAHKNDCEYCGHNAVRTHDITKDMYEELKDKVH